MATRANRVTFTVTAETGKCDGYAELVMGMFTFTQMYLSQPKLKRKVEGGKTIITIETELRDAPLGHMGESDIEVES
jgi:hypothetical protein